MAPAAERVKTKHIYPPKIRALKDKIDDETYLYEAIQRIALVLSNEITGGAGKILKRRKGA